MISALRYGIESSLTLELPDGALVAHCQSARPDSAEPLAEVVDCALARPLEFPTLAQAAVPGDKVVLALDRGVPQAATIVARTIAALLSAGVTPQSITLVRAIADAEAGAQHPLALLLSEVRELIGDAIHDPENRESLSYLGSGANAKPIYIDRFLHDADLVIPIGCLRHDESPGYYGIAAGIFPAFSDTAAQQRYRAAVAGDSAQHARLCRQASEAAWLLGAQFTIQVVPGGGNRVLHVLAGESAAVAREGSRLCAEAWSYRVPACANLVIGTIEGDAAEQSWDNLGRALAAMATVVDQEGAMVLCTDLSQRPGTGIERVVGAEDLEQVEREIDNDRPVDTLAALEVTRAVQRGKVYLISRLDEDFVEDLGLLPVASEQLSRLAARYGSCMVLENVQYAAPRVQLALAAEAPLARRRSRR
jgi:nickel-dependent lactate racemase